MSLVLKGATVVAVLWVVPLASAPSRSDRIVRVYGGTVDTVNVGPTTIQGKRPRSGRGLDWFPNPEDHIPSILPLDLHISS
jgi:hypothetical protein